MELTIREYNERDIPYIKNSLEQLHDYVVQIDPIKRIRKMPGLIDKMSSEIFEMTKTNKGKIYIAEVNSNSVGFAAGFIGDAQSEEHLLEVIPSKSGIISDVYVDTSYRSKGVGKLVVRKVEKYLISMGCDAIWVSTNSFNVKAVGLYKSMGYDEREVSLMKKV